MIPLLSCPHLTTSMFHSLYFLLPPFRNPSFQQLFPTLTFSNSHTSTYLISGHRLSHLSTSLLLFRPHVPIAPSSSSAQPSYQPLPSHQVTLAHSRLLDPSGAYTLQVALRVSDGAKPELMTRGITELLALKEMLKGVVEMAVAERLSLDTRVR